MRRRSRCLRRRQERCREISIRHPRGPPGSAEIGWLEWIEFKCKVVSDFVGEARNALKEAKPDAELGIYVVPDVNGLTEPLTGQRIRDLAPLVDWIAPMLYHNILLQPPAWVASTLAPVVEVAGRKTLPVLQADSNRDPAAGGDWGPPMSDADWSETLSQVAATVRYRRADRLPGNGLDGWQRSFAPSDAWS